MDASAAAVAPDAAVAVARGSPAALRASIDDIARASPPSSVMDQSRARRSPLWSAPRDTSVTVADWVCAENGVAVYVARAEAASGFTAFGPRGGPARSARPGGATTSYSVPSVAAATVSSKALPRRWCVTSETASVVEWSAASRTVQADAGAVAALARSSSVTRMAAGPPKAAEVTRGPMPSPASVSMGATTLPAASTRASVRGLPPPSAIALPAPSVTCVEREYLAAGVSAGPMSAGTVSVSEENGSAGCPRDTGSPRTDQSPAGTVSRTGLSEESRTGVVTGSPEPSSAAAETGSPNSTVIARTAAVDTETAGTKPSEASTIESGTAAPPEESGPAGRSSAGLECATSGVPAAEAIAAWVRRRRVTPDAASIEAAGSAAPDGPSASTDETARAGGRPAPSPSGSSPMTAHEDAAVPPERDAPNSMTVSVRLRVEAEKGGAPPACVARTGRLP